MSSILSRPQCVNYHVNGFWLTNCNRARSTSSATSIIIITMIIIIIIIIIIDNINIDIISLFSLFIRTWP